MKLRPHALNLKERQRGFLLNPFRFGSGGGGGGGGGGGDTDPYFNNVYLLLHGNGVNGSTTFTDSSPLPKILTAHGNAQISTAQSKFGGASIYFDGTGDDLTLANPTAYESTGDFTWELWFNAVSLPAGGVYAGLLTVNSEPSIYLLGSTVVLYRNGTRITSSAVSTGQWYHVALVRIAGVLKLYLNGVSQGSYTDGTTFTPTAMAIASNASNGEYFNGYIDDLRMTKGVGRYSANFTPPVAAYPDVPSGPYIDQYFDKVVLLLHMDGANNSTVLTDSSLYARTSTAFANAKLTTTGPKLGTACAILDGTDDKWEFANDSAITVNNSAFTVEGWAYADVNNELNFIIAHRTTNTATYGGWFMYMTAAGKLLFVFEGGTGASVVMTGTTTIPTGTWFHFALGSDAPGGNARLFLNGALETSATVPTSYAANNVPLSIGSSSAEDGTRNWKGKLDDIRITKGVNRYPVAFTVPTLAYPDVWGDLSFSSVVLLLHGDGASNSTTFTDSSATPKTVTPFGDAKISTTQSKFGGSSIYLDGTGDYLTVPDSADWNFGAGNFTVEMWVYATSAVAYACLIGQHQTSAILWKLDMGSAGTNPRFTSSNSTILCEYTTSAGIISLNAWNHFAVVRAGSSAAIYINGVSVATTVTSITSSSLPDVASDLVIGYDPLNSGRNLAGYIDDLRVTKGLARYTANFTPAPLAFPNA